MARKLALRLRVTFHAVIGWVRQRPPTAEITLGLQLDRIRIGSVSRIPRQLDTGGNPKILQGGNRNGGKTLLRRLS